MASELMFTQNEYKFLPFLTLVNVLKIEPLQ
jgi:hypothetical protein